MAAWPSHTGFMARENVQQAFEMIKSIFRGVLVILIACLTVAGCGETATPDQSSRILAMGDSLLAWNRASNRSVADQLEVMLREPIVDRSVVGAQVIYGLPVSGSMGLRIGSQFRPGNWDWIILNGGGNDLLLGCGCVSCARRLDRLINADGTWGEIPALVSTLRSTGARVIYLGYLRSPGVDSAIEHCRTVGDDLDARLTRLAAHDSGVYFVSLADLVPSGDTRFHDVDRIHPSPRGSAGISQKVARIIQSVPAKRR